MLFNSLFALFGALLPWVGAAPSPIEARGTAGEVPAAREYFYVGGNYIPMGTEHIFANQMYVEKLTPSDPCQPWPLVFIHGNGQSGTNWLNKPDGGSGWATYFLKEGYTIYIIDQTERARSPVSILSLCLASLILQYCASRTAFHLLRFWIFE
jgi:pimeloyl-ACP methyl ester carboxylesterase